MEMRRKLDLFCDSIPTCKNCVLDECCRCGRGAHFLTERPEGYYTLFDDEIRAAYKVAFKKEG